MKALVLGDFHGHFSEELKRKLRNEEFDLVIGVGDYAGIDDFRPYFREMFKILRESGRYLKAEEYFGKKKYQQLLRKDYNSGKKILNDLNSLGKPVIVIFGNSDWCNYPFDKKRVTDRRRLYEKYVKKLKNVKEINYAEIKYCGRNIVGFGGFMEAVSNIKNEKNKKKLEERVLRMARTKKKLFAILKKSGKTDILVLHYPPEGVFDVIKDRKNSYYGESAGVTILREAVRKFKPQMVLCGHMHEYKGMKRLFGVPIINPGEGAKDNYAIVDLESLRIMFK